jgi:plastocyanin
MTEQWTRRQFLRRALVGGVGLSGVFLAACGGGSSATTASTTAGAPATGATAATTVDHSNMPGMTMTAAGASASTPVPAASPSESSTPLASATQGGSATQAAEAVKIVEPSLNYQTWTYEPNDLNVAVGTTIIWTNTGGAAHTVTSDDGKSFDSGPIQPEKQFSRVMDTAGTFPYHCTFHPYMKGTVTVTA